MKKIIVICILVIVCDHIKAQDEVVNGKLTVSDKLVIDNEGNLPSEGSISESNWGNYILTNNSTTRTLRLGVSNDSHTRGEIEIENNNTASSSIFFKTTDTSGGATTRMKIAGNGYVGIGTTSPIDKLDIRDGGLRVSDGNDRMYLKVDNANSKSIIAFGDDLNDRLDLYFDYWGGTSGDFAVMSLLASGRVGIGTTTPDSKLAVKGKIHAEEVKVDLSVPGPDYVFKEDYNLKPLEEVQNYIKAHGHLPNIPSAVEMEANGIQLGAMNMKLLEKIEELVLYTLEQDRKLKEKNQELEAMTHAMQALQLKINAQESRLQEIEKYLNNNR